MTIIPTAVRLTATTAQTGSSAAYLSARAPGSTATMGRDFIAGLASMAADSTAGITTDVGTGGMTTTAALKGARDSSTAASEIEASASVSTAMTSGVAIGTFTATGIFVEALANSTAVTMAVAEATAGDTGSFLSS